MRRTAALILGAGPAGTAAAIALAREGERALLIERTREPHDALCGGFLSWRTLRTLAALGVDADELGRSRIDRVRILVGDRVRDAALPAPGLAVSRARLDAVLQAHAAAAGVGIERGATVQGMAGTTATVDGTPVPADALFLATGKSELRGERRTDPADDPTLGLRVRLTPDAATAAAVAGVVELHLVRHGYVGLAVQEDGSLNCCLAIARSRLRAAGDPAALLDALAAEAPVLGERLAGRRGDEPIDAVANVPYGWRARTGEPGVFRLGDQAAVIPSLAGEGIGIALASGVGAAAAYRRGGPAAAKAWQRQFARRAARPLGIAGLVRRLAESPAAALVALTPPPLIQVVATLTRIDH